MGSQPIDRQLIEIVWWGTRDLRTARHRARGIARCPSRRVPYGPEDPQGKGIHARCRQDGCLGVLHLVYALSVGRLARPGAPPVTARAGYARRVVETVQADLRRSERVHRGLPAKPSRSDGVAGRVEAALRAAAPTAEHARWAVVLFRLVRTWVCRPDRSSTRWPVDAWAAEKSAVDGRLRAIGSPGERAEILADVSAVLDLAERVAGQAWVQDTIRGPLATVILPWPAQEPAIAAPGPDVPTNAELAIFVERYAKLRLSGASPRIALERACEAVLGVRPAHDIDAVLEDLETIYAGRRHVARLQSVAHSHPMP